MAGGWGGREISNVSPDATNLTLIVFKPHMSSRLTEFAIQHRWFFETILNITCKSLSSKVSHLHKCSSRPVAIKYKTYYTWLEVDNYHTFIIYVYTLIPV